MTHAPPTQRGRATRDRIIDIATALVFERGVAGTSLDNVREAACVSKSQLYHYFADKDDLVRAVVDCTVDHVLAAQPRLENLSSWKAIKAWLDDLVQLQADRGCAGGCPIGRLAGQIAEHDEAARQHLAAGFDRWEESLRRGLELMRVSGKLQSSANPAALATATLAAIQGGLVLCQTRRDPGPMRTALDAAYAYLRSFRSEDAAARLDSKASAVDGQ